MKKTIHRVFYILGIALFVYVLKDILTTTQIDNIKAIHPAPILVSTGLSVLAITLIGLLWSSVIKWNYRHEPILKIFNIYCLAGVGKYLPGNIGHHIGRIYLLKTETSVSPTWGTSSIFIEFVLAVLASLTLGLPLLITETSKVFDYVLSLNLSLYFLIFIAFVFIFSFASLFIFKNSLLRHLKALIEFVQNNFAKLIKSYLIMLFAFAIFSFSCGLLAKYILGSERFYDFFWAFPLSWIIGYITPGAPAGLGTREMAMIYLLNHIDSSSVSLISVILRITSVMADLLLFCFGLFMQKIKGSLYERNI